MPKKPSPESITAAFKLGHLVEQRSTLDAQITAGVRQVLALGGTWTTVGIALGVTRQAAQQQYGHQL